MTVVDLGRIRSWKLHCTPRQMDITLTGRFGSTNRISRMTIHDIGRGSPVFVQMGLRSNLAGILASREGDRWDKKDVDIRSQIRDAILKNPKLDQVMELLWVDSEDKVELIKTRAQEIQPLLDELGDEQLKIVLLLATDDSVRESLEPEAYFTDVFKLLAIVTPAQKRRLFFVADYEQKEILSCASIF